MFFSILDVHMLGFNKEWNLYNLQRCINLDERKLYNTRQDYGCTILYEVHISLSNYGICD